MKNSIKNIMSTNTLKKENSYNDFQENKSLLSNIAPLTSKSIH